MTTITIDRAVVEQALERLRKYHHGNGFAADAECIASLESALEQEQAKPLTIERLRDALVASRIIPTAAVEDPDEYDDGVTLFRIEALHRRLT